MADLIKDYLMSAVKYDKYVVVFTIGANKVTAQEGTPVDIVSLYPGYLKHGGEIEIWNDGHLEKTFGYKPKPEPIQQYIPFTYRTFVWEPNMKYVTGDERKPDKDNSGGLILGSTLDGILKIGSTIEGVTFIDWEQLCSGNRGNGHFYWYTFDYKEFYRFGERVFIGDEE